MKRVALALVALLAATLAKPARAHDPFEVTSVVRAGARAVVVETTMARATALAIATGDHRVRATPSEREVLDQRPKLDRAASSLLGVTSDGAPLRLQGSKTELTPDEDVVITLSYEGQLGSALRVEARYLRELPEGYTSAVRAVDAGSGAALGFEVLTASDPVLSVPLVRAGGADSAPAPASASPGFARFFRLGLEHILAGYDHLVFLGGVLLACRGLKGLLALVTSFTAAHSITLALAALGHVSVPGRIVEPLIALSILVVGLENLLLPGEPRRRLALTFVFGLVHGLGFAGALDELAMTAGSVVLPLFSFNLGIEVGQLAVAALAFPLLATLRRTRLGPHALRLASMIVAVSGLSWLCERLVTA